MKKICSVLLVLLIGITAQASDTKPMSISVMTYNLENLFDTQHDIGKEDYTYLPLSVKQSSKEVLAYCHAVRNDYYRQACLNLDWSNNILDKKIKNMAEVISLYNNGKGADIVVFEEVENVNVLKLLIQKGLKGKGYKYAVLLEGDDIRGIDVGMISRYPVKRQRMHQLNLAPYSTRPTRPILEVEFNVGDKVVTVFGNHWPSQSNPDQTRLIAGKTLLQAALKSKSDLVIAAGDFNTSNSDQQSGLKKYILTAFEDVEVKGRKFSHVPALGTHWYRGEWQSLDKIFVLKNSLKNNQARVDYFSYEIPYHSFMLRQIHWNKGGGGYRGRLHHVPRRFDTTTGEGYSDHLPVGVTFDL